MDELNIFDDYKSFIQENDKLVSKLLKDKNIIINRFIPTLKVLNHLYYAHHLRKLTSDEETFFSSGFDYIFDIIHIISTILESKFNNNVDEMEKCGLTINLYLYIDEIKNDIKNFDQKLIKSEIKKLDELSNIINDYLDKKENISEEYYQLFDDITTDIYEKNDQELNTIDNLFYEIALEYNLEIEENNTSFIEEFANRTIH